MRTYTDADGVFVHVDDLAALLRRVAGPLDQGPTERTLQSIAGALDQLKVEALEQAVGTLTKRRSIFDLLGS